MTAHLRRGSGLESRLKKARRLPNTSWRNCMRPPKAVHWMSRRRVDYIRSHQPKITARVRIIWESFLKWEYSWKRTSSSPSTCIEWGKKAVTLTQHTTSNDWIKNCPKTRVMSPSRKLSQKLKRSRVTLARGGGSSDGSQSKRKEH